MTYSIFLKMVLGFKVKKKKNNKRKNVCTRNQNAVQIIKVRAVNKQ